MDAGRFKPKEFEACGEDYDVLSSSEYPTANNVNHRNIGHRRRFDYDDHDGDGII